MNAAAKSTPEARTIYVLRTLLAQQDREQSRVMRRWATELTEAQQAGDWQRVALIRGSIESTAVVVDSYSAALLQELAAKDPACAELAHKLLTEKDEVRRG